MVLMIPVIMAVMMSMAMMMTMKLHRKEEKKGDVNEGTDGLCNRTHDNLEAWRENHVRTTSEKSTWLLALPREAYSSYIVLLVYSWIFTISDW